MEKVHIQYSFGDGFKNWWLTQSCAYFTQEQEILALEE